MNWPLIAFGVALGLALGPVAVLIALAYGTAVVGLYVWEEYLR